MEILPLETSDLHRIALLQPEGWPDIVPFINFYLQNSFCAPFQAVLSERTAGTASAIIFDGTAWLAHVIVHRDFRNRGVGSALVNHLLHYLSERKVRTISLIATDLGFPVYKKAGFREVEVYQSYKREQTYASAIPASCISYNSVYRDDLFLLDAQASGEDRSSFIGQFLSGSYLCVKDGILSGFYLPSLCEGLIVAADAESGRDLMLCRSSSNERAFIPSKNKIASDFLCANEFCPVGTAARMILGDDISWKSHMIYNRIGGKLG